MSLPSARSPRRSDPMWWRLAAFVVGLPLFLVVMLSMLSAASDAGRIPSEIAASKRESSVMLCAEGTIEHSDRSFFGRLFDGGRFRCTSWRMRQGAVETSTGAIPWPTSPRR